MFFFLSLLCTINLLANLKKRNPLDSLDRPTPSSIISQKRLAKIHCSEIKTTKAQNNCPCITGSGGFIATAEFSGSQVYFISQSKTFYSDGTVYINKTEKETISFAGQDLALFVAFSSEFLPQNYYIIELRAVGSNNGISIKELYFDPLEQPSYALGYEDATSSSGEWKTTNVDGSPVFQAVENARCTFKYSGTQFCLIGTKTADDAYFDLIIDGNDPIEVNMKSELNQVQYRKVLFHQKELKSMEHTIEIVQRGTTPIELFSLSYQRFDPTEEFSSSTVFTESYYFSTSFGFSLSNVFSFTEHFSNSETFTKTSSFTNSNSFSQSSDFTKSSSFSKSNGFTKSADFASGITQDPPDPNNQDSGSGSLTTGLIIGLVIGIVLILVCVILFIIVFIRRRAQKEEPSISNEDAANQIFTVHNTQEDDFQFEMSEDEVLDIFGNANHNYQAE